MNNLRHLTKKIGARLTGSAQMVKAEQWGLKTMQESGADKAWLQECMVPHWIRGGKDQAEAHYNAACQRSKEYNTCKNELNILALGKFNRNRSKRNISKRDTGKFI